MVSANRDLRLDFCKGLSLLVIFSNHVAELGGLYPLFFFSWRPFGASDAAEVFVFVSGFVCGLVYYRQYMERGLRACWTKALRRCLQIYLGNILTLAVLLLLIHLFHLQHAPVLKGTGLIPFFDNPLHAIKTYLLLNDMPAFFDVLCLYIVFLALLPVGLMLFHRRPLVAFLLSAAIYGVASLHPLQRMTPFFKIWEFNLDPVGWQFLFFIGMALGCWKRRGLLHLPHHPLLIHAAVGVLLVICVLKMGESLVAMNIFGMGRYPHLPDQLLPFADKIRLGPVRVLHFLTLAYLAALWVPSSAWFLQHRYARWIIECGQNSLAVFCVGIVLSYQVLFLYAHFPTMGWPIKMLLVGCGWLLLLLVGYLLARWHASIPTPVAEAVPIVTNTKKMVATAALRNGR